MYIILCKNNIMDFALVSFVPPPLLLLHSFATIFFFLSAAIMKIILDHF
ncbi:hypothetical protein [Ehrlichia muris]|nr:hypothetical protein [Ehrlichia muris]